MAKALATPLNFSVETGHFISATLGRAVDKSRNPIPMYTYPAIDFLSANKPYLATCSVLEWGAGQSTLWWEKHANSVISVEVSEDWANYTESNLEISNGVTILRCNSEQEFKLKAIKFLESKKFDIIVIDGIAYPKGTRLVSAQASLPLLHNSGLIVVDNSDLASLRSVIDLLRHNGFCRIDFYGYSPGAYYKQCTSFFYKRNQDVDILSGKGNVAVCSPLSSSS